MKGYYHNPCIHGDQLVFVSEDDIWTVPANGGRAIRLTSNLGIISSPSLSEDGKWIAFVGREEGVPDIYVMPSMGGPAKRITWQGSMCTIVGWHDGKIVYASMYGVAIMREMYLYEVSPDGLPPIKLNYGPASSISFGKKGIVIARNSGDPARWKRYRGGTAGYLMIDLNGKGEFSKFLDLKSNIACPMWIGDRIYFISDHEGIGNIYSVKTSGKDLQKHSKHSDYYVRAARTDGKSIVWQAGADLYCLDVKKDKVHNVDIDYNSPFVQRNRKFIGASKHLDGFTLSPDASSLVFEVRGKAIVMGAWEGSVQQYGAKHGVHYRLGTILPNDQGLLLVSDEGDKEHLEIHPLRKDNAAASKDTKVKKFAKADIGRPYDLSVSPDGSMIALTNHRNELCIFDIKKENLVVVEQSTFGMIDGFSWAPDSRWLAYGISISERSSLIKIYNVETKDIQVVSTPVKHDIEPCFDPGGKYLYLISQRTFEPVHDDLQFNIAFLHTSKPYLITLRKDITTPFIQEPKAFEPQPEKPVPPVEGETEPKVKPIEIDFDGITERMIEFPVDAHHYGGIVPLSNKVLYYKFNWDQKAKRGDDMTVDIYCYDMEKCSETLWQAGVSNYQVNADHSAVAVEINKQIRIISTKWDGKSPLPSESEPNRSTGWVDLNRISIEIDPVPEWKQMFREAWRLQKYFFWNSEMSNINWNKVYDRYYPLLDRVGCRSEMSDLVWEMQGELGTSHCYEFGGDYRTSPRYGFGRLGVDWHFDPKKKMWKIQRIVKGDSWLTKNRSPFTAPGINVPEGSGVIAINGEALTADNPPERALINHAGKMVQLTICDEKGKNVRTISMVTMSDETPARYRDWVEANRRYVHEKSKGKVGYIHIPNMQTEGLIEFHRYFLVELDYDGLLVDVRYNGGGSVSQLLLEKLARKRIGYDQTRWFGTSPYPGDAPAGSLVCLTNEHAGSDGDIFSHAFKLMKLGKLVGKRTWGGVIGIWPRHSLVDGTVTTQPEFSFWFKDVGWGVENYGTDPDIEVDILPQDYATGRDPQLDKAIEVVLNDVAANPPLRPNFEERPKLG